MYVVYSNILYFCRFFCLLTIKIFPQIKLQLYSKNNTFHRLLLCAASKASKLYD